MDSPADNGLRERMLEADRRLTAGDAAGARHVLREALQREDLPPLAESMICLNLAVVEDRLGRIDEALAWHDAAIEAARPIGNLWQTEQKAAYLVKLGRNAEAAAAYDAMLRRDDLTDDDRTRIRHNLNVLRGVS
jgi:tetratricopeptide (TPR) repeat protein